MSATSVKELLHQIESLDDADRLKLDRALSRGLEREWATESAKARKISKSRQVDQAAIDRTIERRRYGR